MLHDTVKHDMPADSRELGLHDPLAESFPPGREGRFLFYLAIAFSLFQVATAAHVIDFPSQVVRAIHVGFVTALIFPLLALARGYGPVGKGTAWGLALLGVAVAGYQWVEYEELLVRAGDPEIGRAHV